MLSALTRLSVESCKSLGLGGFGLVLQQSRLQSRTPNMSGRLATSVPLLVACSLVGSSTPSSSPHWELQREPPDTSRARRDVAPQVEQRYKKAGAAFTRWLAKNGLRPKRLDEWDDLLVEYRSAVELTSVEFRELVESVEFIFPHTRGRLGRSQAALGARNPILSNDEHGLCLSLHSSPAGCERVAIHWTGGLLQDPMARQVRRFCGLRLNTSSPCYRLRDETRCLPSFLIVGVMKAGTTALAQYLAEHPQVLPPDLKEPYFFTDQNAQWPLCAYAALFPPQIDGSRWHTFDATPSMIFDASAAEWIGDMLPDTRVIVLLRDPVARAHSHWQFSSYLALHSNMTECMEGRQKLAEIVPKFSLDHWVGQSEAWRTLESCGATVDEGMSRASGKLILNQSNAGWPVLESMRHCLANSTHDAHYQALVALGEIPRQGEPEANHNEQKDFAKSDWELVQKCTGGSLNIDIVRLGKKYAEGLRIWLAHIRKEQLLILHTEEMSADTLAILDKVHKFLGLEAHEREPGAMQPAKICPLDFKPKVGAGEAESMHNVGLCSRRAQLANISPPSIALRRRLEAYYHPSVAELSRVLGYDPGYL